MGSGDRWREEIEVQESISIGQDLVPWEKLSFSKEVTGTRKEYPDRILASWIFKGWMERSL